MNAMSLDARYLLNQINDLECKRREEQVTLIEEQTKHQRTTQELSQINEELKLQQYKTEQLKLKLSQLEFQDIPNLKKREEVLKETYQLTKSQIEVTEKDTKFKMEQSDCKINNLQQVVNELLDNKQKSIDYWNQLASVKQMHDLEQKLKQMENELSSQLEARDQSLKQMKHEADLLEKTNERLNRELRDLIIEKQVLDANQPDVDSSTLALERPAPHQTTSLDKNQAQLDELHNQVEQIKSNNEQQEQTFLRLESSLEQKLNGWVRMSVVIGAVESEQMCSQCVAKQVREFYSSPAEVVE